MLHDYLVLVGSNNSVSGPNTFGTGFLIFKENTCYVVTCRHVIREAAIGVLFALPKPKKTKSPPGGYLVLALGAPRFHPQDNEEGIFDIAVLPIRHTNRQLLEAIGIVPFDIMNSPITSNFREGEMLFAEGYPSDYSEAALKEDSNESLLPKHVQGIFRTIPLKNISRNGFDAPLREAFFAQIKDDDPIGKGMSGGIVRLVNGKQIAGIVLASGDFTLSIQGRGIEKFNGFIFSNASRILEIMYKIKI